MSPHLNIVSLGVFEAAQIKLSKLQEIYGKKEGHLLRGTPVHFTQLYPKVLLGGLVFCAECGHRLHTGGKGRNSRKMYCPNHRNGTCAMSTLVPLDLAEQKIVALLSDLLTSYPDWVQAAVAKMQEAIVSAKKDLPENLTILQSRLADLQRQQSNLLRFVREGHHSTSLGEDLARVEAEIATLEREIVDLQTQVHQHEAVPDEPWIAGKLRDLVALLKTQMPAAAMALRQVLGQVMAHPMIMPGKKRGFIQLRFCIRGSAMIRAAIGADFPKALCHAGETGAEPDMQTFFVDLGGPTNMDRHASTVVQMRMAGAPWKAIAAATGLKIQNAYLLFKRHSGAHRPTDTTTQEPPTL